MERYVPSVERFMVAGLGREIHFALIPLLSCSLAALVYLAALRGRRSLSAALAAVAIVLVGLTAAGLGRISIPVVLGPLLLLIAVRRVGARGIAAFSAIAVVVAVLSVVFIGFVRQAYPVPRNAAELSEIVDKIRVQVVSKLIVRQAISGWCFDRVARRQVSEEDPKGPFYFVVAVVPRTFWPEKPNLSRGSEYAVKFCGFTINPKAPHSESITLLGEPILNGGVMGIVVAQIFLGLALTAATVAGLRTGALGVVSLTAMLPWLTQFEQHFALYVANGVKMFLFVTPLLAAWFIIDRLSERRAR